MVSGRGLTRGLPWVYTVSMKKAKVSMQEFVRAWQESATFADVLKVTGLTSAAARSRASLCRKHGVPLKVMVRVSSVDWKALAVEAVALVKRGKNA